LYILLLIFCISLQIEGACSARKFIPEIAGVSGSYADEIRHLKKSQETVLFFIKVSEKEGIALLAANKKVETIYTIVYTLCAVEDIHYL